MRSDGNTRRIDEEEVELDYKTVKGEWARQAQYQYKLNMLALIEG
jgi:hypothetical protein